jgi:hypothetical protein
MADLVLNPIQFHVLQYRHPNRALGFSTLQIQTWYWAATRLVSVLAGLTQSHSIACQAMNDLDCKPARHEQWVHDRPTMVIVGLGWLQRCLSSTHYLNSKRFLLSRSFPILLLPNKCYSNAPTAPSNGSCSLSSLIWRPPKHGNGSFFMHAKNF